MPGDENIEKLQIGIGADLSQLESDLKDAEKKIVGLSDKIDKDPIKIAVTPDVDAKAFIAKIQQAVASQVVKVKVDPGEITKASKASVEKLKTTTASIEPPKLDISDATGKLDFFEQRVEEIKRVAGSVDVTVKIDTDPLGEVTKGVITYTNALGDAQTETYKLVNVVDEMGGAASKQFQFVGERMTESTTKSERFAESLKSLENSFNAFAIKNVDLADQVGLDNLRAKLNDVKNDTNAEVLSVQRLRNEFGAVKVKVDEIRAAQRAQAETSRLAAREQMQASQQQRAAQRAALQESMAYEQAINQLRAVSSSSYRQEQLKIKEILKQQVDTINRRVAAEKRAPSWNKQATAALMFKKATIETTAYTARLSVYAKDLARRIEHARNNVAGMQGYARSTMNIFKGIVLSQAFYKGLNAIKGVVREAWDMSVMLNSSEAAFSGMLVGGQEQAKALLEVLKQEAINTPFDIKNLTEAARLLTAYGIQAENLMYIMRAVEQSAAISGDASRMDRISLALGQIYTKGRLVGEEVRQLTEAGIAVSEILTEELGLTREDLKKGWAALSIDANTAINAIVRGIDKRYGQALDNMAKTTRQKINNMRESFALITSSLTDPIRRAIDTIIDTVTPRVEQLYQAIQAIGLGNALKTLIPPELFNAVITAINGIVRAAQAIGVVFKQIKPVVTAVMDALAWYGGVIYDVFMTILSVLGIFGKAVGESSSGVATLGTALKYLFGAMLAVKVGMMAVAAASKILSVVSTVLRGILLMAEGVSMAMRVLSAVSSVAGISMASGFTPVIGVLLVVIGLVAALAGSLGSVIDAAKRVGAALKSLGGGTTLGNVFKDMSGNLQEQIDAYNAKVARQNADMSNALIENSDEQTDQVDSAAGATKKAMQGLMSFDEVYKLMEPSAGGAGAIPEITVDLDIMPTPDMGGFFDDVGGLGEDLFADLSLTELQDALSGLWTEISPLLDTILIYGAKMLMYFQQMKLYSKLMTTESEEQWRLEKSQTSEDEEQLLQEQKQTTEDEEQLLQEQKQTTEDEEQLLQEQKQTTEDEEQLLQEQKQTTEDEEQLLQEQKQTTEDEEQLLQEQKQTTEDEEQLLQEQKQTTEDEEQLLQEQKQTTEDEEQLLQEQKQTTEDEEQLLQEQKQTTEDEEQLLQEQKQTTEDEEQLLQEQKQSQQDSEQLIYEKQQTEEDREQWTISRTGGAGGGAGTKGTAAALALINVAQIAASTKLLIDNFKEIADGSADLSTWMSLFVNGLMMAVDVLQLITAFKLISGGAGAAGLVAKGGKAVAAGVGGKAAIDAGIGAGAAAGIGSLGAFAGFLALPIAAGAAVLYLGDTLESVGKNINDFNKDHKKSVGVGEQARETIQEEADQAKALTAEYATLASQDELTVAGRDRMKSIAQKLVDIYPELNNYVDQETGLLGLSATSMNDYVDAAKQRASIDFLSDDKLRLLEEERQLVGLLKAAEAEEDEARAKYAASGSRWDKLTLDSKTQHTDEIRKLLDRNRVDLKNNEIEHSKYADAIESYEASIGESVEDRMQKEAEALTKQQDAYHKYYQDFESKASTHQTRLNALSAEGYAEQSLTMDGWMKGMTERQRQEYERQENLAKLSGGRIPAAMLAELEAAGPGYGKLIEELANSNDEKLQEVVGVWEGNARLAKELALEELGPLPEDARLLLERYKTATDEELEKIVDSYATQHGLSRQEAIAELSGLPDESAAILREAINYVETTAVTDIRKAYKDLGDAGAKGFGSKKAVIDSAFKGVLNTLLTSMGTFTGKTTNALNSLLSGFKGSMNNLAVSTQGKVTYTPVTAPQMKLMADGGVIHRAARGIQLLRKPTMLAPNVMGGEAGDEIVFPLENTQFIKSFADEIAVAVGNNRTQQAAMNINVQMDQARAGAGATAFSAPTATEISDAIRSWFTPQMQSLHDVLEQDRVVDIQVPHTTNAMWRAILSELKAANAGAGARGLSLVK